MVGAGWFDAPTTPSFGKSIRATFAAFLRTTEASNAGRKTNE
jgi:hypothetical protein